MDLRWKESPRELFKMALGVLNKGFNIDTEMVKRKPELKPFQRERDLTREIKTRKCFKITPEDTRLPEHASEMEV